MKHRPSKKNKAKSAARSRFSGSVLLGKYVKPSSSVNRLIQWPIRFFSGLHKWYVALKYKVFRFSGGVLGSGKMPWLKVSILVLAVFFVFKKDIKLTLNMGALKHSAAAQPHPKEKSSTINEMGISPSISAKSDNKKITLANASMLSQQDVDAYISRFLKVAQMEYKKYRIPVSIKLAQGLAESEAGKNNAALTDNNHFGGAMQIMTYHTAWENWRAHSVLLHRSYPELFEMDSQDYKSWAQALKKSGYSKKRNYDQILINIIETFSLQQFDV